VRVDVPEPPDVRTILAGFREAVAPDGETVATRLAVPLKPLTLPDWICNEPELPLLIARVVELEESEKSTTVTETRTECEIEPIVPVIVTV
jgi:hypothetical protein